MGEKISKIIRQILLCTILYLGAVSCSKYREFKSIGKWKSLCNNESVGMYTRIGNKIYGGNATGIAINKLTSPLNGVDVESFKVCIGSDYAKDKNHVYYPIRMMCSVMQTPMEDAFLLNTLLRMFHQRILNILVTNMGRMDMYLFNTGKKSLGIDSIENR